MNEGILTNVLCAFRMMSRVHVPRLVSIRESVSNYSTPGVQTSPNLLSVLRTGPRVHVLSLVLII